MAVSNGVKKTTEQQHKTQPLSNLYAEEFERHVEGQALQLNLNLLREAGEGTHRAVLGAKCYDPEPQAFPGMI